MCVEMKILFLNLIAFFLILLSFNSYAQFKFGVVGGTMLNVNKPFEFKTDPQKPIYTDAIKSYKRTYGFYACLSAEYIFSEKLALQLEPHFQHINDVSEFQNREIWLNEQTGEGIYTDVIITSTIKGFSWGD